MLTGPCGLSCVELATDATATLLAKMQDKVENWAGTVWSLSTWIPEVTIKRVWEKFHDIITMINLMIVKIYSSRHL